MIKKWFIFYTTLIIALLVNGFFGIYKQTWLYFEATNMLLLSMLCFAIAYEYYQKKKMKKILCK